MIANASPDCDSGIAEVVRHAVSRQDQGRVDRAHQVVTQRVGPAHFTLAVSGLLVVLTAHSHSGSQFLPHLPQHWKSIMYPPHCGQTRLMIEEIMLAFGSPGIVSMCLIVSLPNLTTGFSSKSSPSCEDARRSQGPRTTVNLLRVSVALSGPCWLAYGVRLGHLYRLPPRSVHDPASAMPMPNTRMRSPRVSRVRTFGKLLATDGLSRGVRQNPWAPGMSLQGKGV